MAAEEVKHFVKRVYAGIIEVMKLELSIVWIRNNPTSNSSVDKICSLANKVCGRSGLSFAPILIPGLMNSVHINPTQTRSASCLKRSFWTSFSCVLSILKMKYRYGFALSVVFASHRIFHRSRHLFLYIDRVRIFDRTTPFLEKRVEFINAQGLNIAGHIPSMKSLAYFTILVIWHCLSAFVSISSRKHNFPT